MNNHEQTNNLIHFYQNRLLQLQQQANIPDYVGEIEVIRATIASLEQALPPTRPRSLVPETQRPPRHPGLVVLVGPGRPGDDPLNQSAIHAIRYHHDTASIAGLRVCWLLASGGQHGSLAVAEALQVECARLGVIARIWAISDPFSVQSSYETVQRVFSHDVPRYDLVEEQVICDFTGGTKPMTAGMILACSGRRTMQYMTGGKAGIASVPLLVSFAPETSS